MDYSKKGTVATLDDSHLKLIMGLKLRQLRVDKGMSLAELAEATGISISYLNEIEKGKKLPKPDKISVLANTLEVSYDWLVSMKMNKKMAPVAEILQSKMMKEVLLDVFGIDKSQLLDLLAKVPVKLNAFLNTVIEISRNYGMRVENFYFSALRSYQEMHENYFPDIEESVDDFYKIHQLHPDQAIQWEVLRDILVKSYHCSLEEDGLSNQPELKELRSVFLPGKHPRLLLNVNLNRTQKAFIIAREIGFQFLGLNERPYTTSWVQFDSFEQVLNNFRASYFACALMLQREKLIGRISSLINQSSFMPAQWVDMLEEFKVSPEMLAHRITNLLPRYFGIQELFFLRFSQKNGTDDFELTKEMHLAGLHNPHANMMHEHYCRRWISINILKNLSVQLKKGTYSQPLCFAQRSRYFGNEKEYLILTFAKPSLEGTGINHSISIGLLLTSQLKKKVQFWNDPTIPIRMVGETCERCPAVDCAERVAEPKVLMREQRLMTMRMALEALSGK
ncbi:MAG TPA: XRE family transcriptional regulator [Chryseosolibacter sp.]